MENQLTVKEQVQDAPGWGSASGFELMQRQAKLLSSSALVPQQFAGNIANCVIGLEIANRLGASPLAVMQSLYIVHGKPSWSSQFIIAAINSTGNFSPLRYTMAGEGDDKGCVAWATEKATGERLESPRVTIGMAKAEGWYSKNGSKWQTMPDLMLRYRAATLFGRLYAPEVLMGMKAHEEILDIETDVVEKAKPAKPIFTKLEEIAAVVAPQAGDLAPEVKKDGGMTDLDKLKVLCDESDTSIDGVPAALKACKQLPERASIKTVDQLSDESIAWAVANFGEVFKHLPSK